MTRFEMLFHHASSTTVGVRQPVVRTGGWSESLFFDETASTWASDLNRLQISRAGLLPDQASIIGQRYEYPDGSTNTDNRIYGGSSGESVDVPQMALEFSCKDATVKSVRHWTIRGLPDAWVIRGEISTDTAVSQAIQRYLAQMAGFRWKCVDKSAATAGIVEISSNGNYELDVAFTLAVGSYVKLLRCRDQYGRAAKGKFYVNASPTVQTGTLANWPAGIIVQNGRMRLVSSGFGTFAQAFSSVSRVMVKKIGRSFFQYRGRASKRSA